MSKPDKHVIMTTKQKAESTDTSVIIAYKGFDRDFVCHPSGGERVEYAVGETYTIDGPIKVCKRGFHACEHPLGVFAHYSPVKSRYAEVELRGKTSRENDSTKIAAAQITIKAELLIPDLVARAVKWVMDRALASEGASATGYQGAASATGNQGRVMAAEGNAMFLVERASDDTIISVWAGIAGRDGIKPKTWYTLSSGEPVEVDP